MKKEKQGNLIARVIAFIVGFILVFLGGVDLGITTIPGVALIIWSIVGGKFRLIK